MFYRHTNEKTYKLDLCDDELNEKGWCNTKSFRFTYVSSNHPVFFETRTGYVICKDEFGYNLVEAKVRLVSQIESLNQQEH